MSQRLCARACFILATICATELMAKVHVDDAYVRSSTDVKTWMIGTKAVEMVFKCKDGRFRTISFKNKLVDPIAEYILPETATAPFTVETPVARRYAFEQIWVKQLSPGNNIDTAESNLKLNVKQGDMIGFSAGSPGPWGDQTKWVTTVDYGDRVITVK